MTGDPSWWDRNAVMVQTLATLALIGVTAVYVWLTRNIATATKEQADATRRQAAAAEKQVQQANAALDAERSAHEAQLAQMRADLDLQREIASQADKHAQNVLIESAKARLSALTPVCTVLWSGSPMTQADETSIGNVQLDVFERGATLVRVVFQVRNDSPYPALVTAPPVVIEDEDLAEIPEWASSVRDEVLLGGATLSLTYKIRGPGAMFARWATQHRRVQFDFETRSPITGVIDRHSWTGTFPAIETVIGSNGAFFDHSASSGFFGSRAAYPTRFWPAGFGEN